MLFIRKDYDRFRQYSHPVGERGETRRERMVFCRGRAGEERRDSCRGRGAEGRADGPSRAGFWRAAGARGEEDVRDRGGVGEGRDLAGRIGEVGGAATSVIPLMGILSRPDHRTVQTSDGGPSPV